MYHFNNNEIEVECLKDGKGQLVCVQVGVRGIVDSRLFLYDGLDDTGDLIAEIDMNDTDNWVGFDCEFFTGLAYKTTEGAGKFTVVFM